MAAHFKVKVDAKRCKSCELCVAVCPKNIIVISEKKNEQGFRLAVCQDEDACTGCLACAQVCPDVAIEIVRKEQA
ncbi:MAG: 4Fe-4S binding protein [Candidatus Firestonebacteria bacterium]|nr:4Fe-4S binding protein [Candidatus Firestonebacteria bacterium]